MQRLPDLSSEILSYNDIKLHINKVDFWSTKLRLQNDNWLFNSWRDIWKTIGWQGDGVLLDVGANYGVASWEFHKKSYCSSVIMFEPIEENCECIQRSFENSELDYALHQTAVGNTTGTISFQWNKTQTGTSKVVDDGTGNRTIPICTLDSLDLPKIKVMKVDVEGHELAVFQGAEQLIQRDQPWIFFECNSKTQEDLDRAGAILAWLKDQDYVCVNSSWHHIENVQHIELANLASRSIIHPVKDLFAIPRSKLANLPVQKTCIDSISAAMMEKLGKSPKWYLGLPWAQMSRPAQQSLGIELVEGDIQKKAKSTQLYTLLDNKPYHTWEFFQRFPPIQQTELNSELWEA